MVLLKYIHVNLNSFFIIMNSPEYRCALLLAVTDPGGRHGEGAAHMFEAWDGSLVLIFLGFFIFQSESKPGGENERRGCRA
jgi:hypothetical protein